MASPPPFLADDQTDEDFFNNLIDDDLGVPGSGPERASVERALSDLSIGDDGAALEDSTPGDSGIATREENHPENNVACPSSGSPKVKALSVEGSTTLAPTGSFDSRVEFETLDSKEQPKVQVSAPLSAPVANGPTMEATSEVESSVGKGGGSKGITVKEVQWSAFRVDSQQSDSDGFGSNVDFSIENAVKCDNMLQASIGQEASPMENSIANACSYLDSSQQHDAQWTSSATEQVGDVNDPQYWENLYPGWKFDVSTGQWYQINDHNTTATATEAENIYALKEEQLDQDKILSPGNEIRVGQSLESSYSRQSASSVVAAIAEDRSAGHVSNWNQDSFWSSEYPANMVFDPQYPGWYYDTNTQQWHTLESYTQTIQATTSTANGQINLELPFSNGLVEGDSNLDNEVGQFEQNISETHYSKVMAIHQDSSRSMSAQDNIQKPETMTRLPDFSENQHKTNFYNTTGHVAYVMNGQVDHRNLEPLSTSDYGYSNGTTRFQSFVPPENMGHINQPKVVQNFQEFSSHGHYDNQNPRNHFQQPVHHENPSYSNFSYALNEGQSSAGRPPHALVTFGFGGKVIVMKDATCSGTNLDYGNKDSTGGTISILGLMDILTKETDDSSTMDINYSYFHALCQQSFPGPLVGGNASAKDVNKWIDDRITYYQSPVVDAAGGNHHSLLLALLKILCQHYGKLQSPYSSDPSFEDVDGPGSAVTSLFASVSKNGASPVQYGSLSDCMQCLPTEGEMEGTAIMVQKLLISGRRREALQCAQAGRLWGLALVLAAQLGEKFYVETVKQMANRQFVSGSPLRTLCLLTAGQPADIFSSGSSSNSTFPTTDNAPGHSQVLSSGILDDWEKHLAIITANRTKDDELVIIHLGDSVWREKGEISAAHICYLVAEASLESYSDSTRMCLLGADHWKCPRTYASPDAIQRTELYEYSKVLGNSQFILLPFQPYKLVYAYMLAEVGKLSDSLRYCQAATKLLKSSSRTPGTETLKSLFLSLEERLRMHQQGGYNTNLDPAKLVGKLFTSIDRSIHRMIGTASSPSSPMPQSNEKEDNFVVPKVVNSQSTMAMSSLIPSGSAESISDWANSSKNMMQGRSVSEPDFGKALKQEKTIDAPDSESKAASRLGRFGSQIYQTTVGWVSRSRSDHQAKLGERNKFYYDEKLKRWVEEGAEPQSDEPPLPPPPTTASFQNGISANNTESTFKSSNGSANGISETTSTPQQASRIPISETTSTPQQASRIPPMSPNPSQFSARNKMGVRSRYVDTFNKGGGAFTNSFKPPSSPSANPAVGGNFFVPSQPATCDEKTPDTAAESTAESLLAAESSAVVGKEAPLSPRSQSIPLDLPHFPGSDSNAFSNYGTPTAMEQSNNGSLYPGSRAASWCGNHNAMLTPTMALVSSSKQGLPVPSSQECSSLHLDNSNSQLNCANMGEGLHDVAL